eukprot:3428315-Rhodomonas_salina.1
MYTVAQRLRPWDHDRLRLRQGGHSKVCCACRLETELADRPEAVAEIDELWGVVSVGSMSPTAVYASGQSVRDRALQRVCSLQAAAAIATDDWETDGAPEMPSPSHSASNRALST